MGWFGSSDDDDQKPSTSSYTDQGFGGQTEYAPASSMSSSGGGSFEQEVAMEQQQAIVKAAMFKLTELAFSKCVHKPSSSLSSSEQSCISAVVSKYLDVSEMVTSGMAGQ